MHRTRCIMGTLVVSVVAIFATQTVQVGSSRVEVRQTARGGTTEGASAEKLLGDSDCRSCHATDRKVVGPSYTEIARRYAAQADATDKLARSIRQGGSGNWGS